MKLARMVVVALLCASLVALPGIAFAAPAPTYIQMITTNTRIGYQQYMTIKGVLRDSLGKPMVGRRVVVQYSANGIPITKLTSVLSGADGSVKVTVRPLWATCYRFTFTGDAANAASVGGDAIITPKASLPVPEVPLYVRAARRFTVYGWVRPMDRAANRSKPGYNSIKIEFWRYQSGRYVHKYDRWVTARKYPNYWGKYSLSAALSSRGTWRLRTVHWCAEHTRTFSTYHKFVVK